MENLTGLEVTEVNIQVNDVILPELASAGRAARRLRRLVSTLRLRLRSQHFSKLSESLATSIEPDRGRGGRSWQAEMLTRRLNRRRLTSAR